MPSSNASLPPASSSASWLEGEPHPQHPLPAAGSPRFAGQAAIAFRDCVRSLSCGFNCDPKAGFAQRNHPIVRRQLWSLKRYFRKVCHAVKILCPLQSIHNVCPKGCVLCPAACTTRSPSCLWPRLMRAGGCLVSRSFSLGCTSMSESTVCLARPIHHQLCAAFVPGFVLGNDRSTPTAPLLPSSLSRVF